MLAIYLYREGERTQRITSGKHEVWLGAFADADVRLAGHGVADRHCKLMVRPAGCFLIKEAGSVAVNGKPLARSTALYAGDTVYIGPYSFMIELLPRDPDPKEEKLLADINAGDDASRLVYADWLEENGDLRRADFLRTQEQMAELDTSDTDARIAFVEQSRRLRTLAALVDVEWRMRVARAPVEGCKVARFDFQCTQQWSALSETETASVRFCDLCHRHVYYCASIAEARQHAWRGECVAVDITNERHAHDLDRPPPMVGMIAPR